MKREEAALLDLSETLQYVPQTVPQNTMNLIEEREKPLASSTLASDVALGCLLAKIWEVQESDTAQLLSLCDSAVALANASTDERGRLWAHLSRVLYASAERPVEATRADLAIIHALLVNVSDPRAHQLARVCDAAALAAVGQQAAASDRLVALPAAADVREDDADDFFLLRVRAVVAAGLGDIETTFHAAYANLMLAERTGPPVRYAAAALILAQALCTIDRPEEALALLDHLFFTVGVPANNRRLRLAARHQLAVCKALCGRNAEALADLQQLADGSLATDYWPGPHAALTSLCNELARYEEASRWLPLAYEAANASTGQPALMGECHLNAARLACWRGDLPGATDLLEQAVECLERDPVAATSSPTRMSAGPLLAQCYADAGNFERAYGTNQRLAPLMQRRTDFLARGHLASVQAKQSVSSRIQLTERELRCLSWCAAGKTAWETGQILQISEWTVVYHLEKAKRKFGLTRKQQVVARAISLGLISGQPEETR